MTNFYNDLKNLYNFTRPKKLEEKKEEINIGDDDIIETDDGKKWKKDGEGNLMEI